MALPSSIDKWRRDVRALSIPAGVLSRNDFPSGSKFSKEHFYALRVFYPLRKEQIKKQCFPSDSVQKVTQKLKANSQLKKAFQLLDRKIDSWTSQDLLDASGLGPGLAQLQLIVHKQEFSEAPADPADSAGEGVDMHEILNSPAPKHSVKAGKAAEVGLPIRPKPMSSLPFPATPTPAPKEPAMGGQHLLSLPSTPAAISLTTPSAASTSAIAPLTASTAPFTASSIASTSMEDSIYIDELERAIFQVGDEQTVNACLVNLLLPVTWACGFSRSVHIDRRAFYMGPNENPLYRALVDGVIMIEDSIKGFIEVKRSLRAFDEKVRLQESAQMAAFIYAQGPTLGSQNG